MLSFNVKNEKFDIILTWERLLSAPFFLFEDVFQEIGNPLGVFPEVDLKFTSTILMDLACILVVYITKGWFGGHRYIENGELGILIDYDYEGFLPNMHDDIVMITW